jgi:hypothetical protein
MGGTSGGQQTAIHSGGTAGHSGGSSSPSGGLHGGSGDSGETADGGGVAGDTSGGASLTGGNTSGGASLTGGNTSGGGALGGSGGGRSQGGATGGAEAGSADAGAAGGGGVAGATCPSAPVFYDLPLTPDDPRVPPAFARAVAPEVMAPGIAFTPDSGPSCIGAKISSDVLLFTACDVVEIKKVKVVEGGQTGVLAITDRKVTNRDARAGFEYLPISPYGENRPVAFTKRRPFPDEPVTLLAYQSGVIRVAHATLPSKAFDGPVDCGDCPTSGSETERMLAFGGDSRLVAFCKLNACGGASDCLSLESAEKLWAELVDIIAAAEGLLLGDLDGDARMDAVAIKRGQVLGRLSNGTLFSPSSQFASGGLSGADSNALGDVDGDDRADLITIGNGISVYPGDGSHFGDALTVSTSRVSSDGARVANVDGEGAGEIVLWQGAKIVVIRDPTTSPAFETWYDGLPAGVQSFDVADVTGDGLGDVILGFTDHVAVLVGDGRGFAAPQDWLLGVPTTPPGWFFADVNGDHLADAIRVDLYGSQVYPSTGAAFEANGADWREIPIGERGNSFADVTGDGLADAIIQNQNNIVVLPSSGSNFGGPARWSSDGYSAGGW